MPRACAPPGRPATATPLTRRRCACFAGSTANFAGTSARRVPVRGKGGRIESWVGSLTDIQDQKDHSETLERAIQIRTKELRAANQALHDEVGERIRAEERARTAAVELRRSNDELEKFAYVASHDLQEPLRKIQAFGDRLLRKCRAALDDQGRDYLDRMLTSATRMRSLINDLLAFSRVATQNRPFVPVDLNEILGGVLEDLEDRLAQSQGRVESTPLPTVNADPVQFRQLFQNLIGNALKFAKPGEPPVVTIAATPMADVPENADPPPLPGRTGWRLTFADNGIGFEQQHEKRIFELFQRLHGRHEYEGTGIGLAICRKIVERHGGAIRARSEPGHGARFLVDLLDAPTGRKARRPSSRQGERSSLAKVATKDRMTNGFREAASLQRVFRASSFFRYSAFVLRHSAQVGR